MQIMRAVLELHPQLRRERTKLSMSLAYVGYVGSFTTATPMKFSL